MSTVYSPTDVKLIIRLIPHSGEHVCRNRFHGSCYSLTQVVGVVLYRQCLLCSPQRRNSLWSNRDFTVAKQWKLLFLSIFLGLSCRAQSAQLLQNVEGLYPVRKLVPPHSQSAETQRSLTYPSTPRPK